MASRVIYVNLLNTYALRLRADCVLITSARESHLDIYVIIENWMRLGCVHGRTSLLAGLVSN